MNEISMNRMLLEMAAKESSRRVDAYPATDARVQAEAEHEKAVKKLMRQARKLAKGARPADPWATDPRWGSGAGAYFAEAALKSEAKRIKARVRARLRAGLDPRTAVNG